MNIAIVGSSGYIAGFLLNEMKRFPEIKSVLKIDKTSDADEQLDLEMPEQFNYSSLDDIDYIIFTAAISGPDQCAKEFDFCWKINVTGTEYFIKEASKRGCKTLFFSSDAVFGDIPGEVYHELSKTQANTPYGKMKKAVEDAFENEPNFKCIRLSYVVSERDRFVSYCLKCIENNEVADVFHPLYRNCIVISDVINTVLWIVRNWSAFVPNRLNVAGRELVSRVRIADEINRYCGDRLTYRISTPEAGFFENRPKITQMVSLYLKEYNIIEELTFSEKIKKELEDIK